MRLKAHTMGRARLWDGRDDRGTIVQWRRVMWSPSSLYIAVIKELRSGARIASSKVRVSGSGEGEAWGRREPSIARANGCGSVPRSGCRSGENIGEVSGENVERKAVWANARDAGK